MSADNDRSRIAKVRCPYYKRHTKAGCVICEGAVEGTTISFRFRNREAMRWFMRVYCEKDYWKCVYCEAVDEAKYREEE